MNNIIKTLKAILKSSHLPSSHPALVPRDFEELRHVKLGRNEKIHVIHVWGSVIM